MFSVSKSKMTGLMKTITGGATNRKNMVCHHRWKRIAFKTSFR
jgi:hypothetical protein